MKKIIQIVGNTWNNEKVHNSCEIHNIKTVNMDKLINEFDFLNGDTINVNGKIYLFKTIILGDKQIHVDFFNPMGSMIYASHKYYTVSRDYIEITDVKTNKVTKYVRHWNPKTCIGSYIRFTKNDKAEII